MVTTEEEVMAFRDQPIPRRNLYIESGATGLRRFGGYVHEDFDPQLNGYRAAAVFDEMRRNDPDVASVLSAIEFLIHSVEWSVIPAGETPQDQEAALFLEQCMNDMDFSWHDFISDVCSMFTFGWAWFELVYKQRNGLVPTGGDSPSLHEDGRVGWHKISLRGQESLLRWEFGPTGDIQAMIQRVLWSPAPQNLGKGVDAVAGSYEIPYNKSILFRVKREKNNPEGWSILRAAYRPYYIKKTIEEIEVQGAEKDMVGTLMIRLPANATSTDKENAQRILEDYHSGDQTGLLLPRVVNDPTLIEMDWQAELIKSPGHKVVDTDKIIVRCSNMIARTSLAQFLSLGQNRQGGSRAVGEVMWDLFHLAVNGHLDNIQDTIQRFLVRPLFELNNFPVEKFPKIVHSDLGEIDGEELANLVSKLMAQGFPVDDPAAVNTVRTKMGLPELSDEFFAKREEEMKRQQELQLQAKQTAPTGPGNTKPPGDNKIKVDTNPTANKKPTPIRKTAAEWREWLAS